MNKFVEKSRKGLMGIYKILNNVTEEIYIGSSRSVANRIQQHINDLTDKKRTNLSVPLETRDALRTLGKGSMERAIQYLLDLERKSGN